MISPKLLSTLPKVTQLVNGEAGYDTATDFSHYWTFSQNLHVNEIRTQTLKFPF